PRGGAGADRAVDVEEGRGRGSGPAHLHVVGARGGRRGGGGRRGRRAGVGHSGGPDLLAGSPPAVGPGGEEDAGPAGEAVVVAELVPEVGRRLRLVGRRRGELEGRAPGGAAVVGGLVPDVDLRPPGVVHRVVVDDGDRAGALVDRHPGVELVVRRARVVELRG